MRVWDVETGQPLGCGKGHASTPEQVGFSGDGRRVWSCGDNTLRIWETVGVKPLYTLVAGSRCTGGAGSTDGRRFAASDFDQQARLWQMPD